MHTNIYIYIYIYIYICIYIYIDIDINMCIYFWTNILYIYIYIYWAHPTSGPKAHQAFPKCAGLRCVPFTFRIFDQQSYIFEANNEFTLNKSYF